jgi:type VI protein secretion system component VasK
MSFEEVHARLEESDQNLLAQAVLSEDARTSHEEVLAAMESMRRTGEQQRRSQLKTRIHDSERAGNRKEALRLTGELQGLERAAREHGSATRRGVQ